jgi:Domain of unknown function (DUF5666)
MFTARPLRTFFSLLALATFAAACGGGDNDPPPSTPTAAIGPITAFGSVVVNGTRFDDSAATVSIEDATLSRDRLRLGMVVQVEGFVQPDGNAVATRIRYNDCVEGPVTAINRVQNTLTVLGQTVAVDDDTVFDGVTQRDMNAFAIGDLVEASCLPDRTRDQVRAARLERKGVHANGSDRIEATGVVANLNLAAGTCTIGGLTVNFAGIAAGDRPAGLANGMTVEASGLNFAGGVLTADRLRDRDRDRLNWPDATKVEVEGYVADFVSIGDFKVDGQRVDARNAVIRNGTAADIVNGVKVEAEGRMSNGVLVASLLVLKLQTNVRIEAQMQTKDTAASTVTLLGKAVSVDANTALIDRLASNTQPTVLTLGALVNGDRLEVRAARDASGKLLATRVERTPADPLVVIKAPAEAKTPTTSLTLLGIGVTTGANTRYRDVNGTLVDAATFYGAVQVPPAVPSVVHARGVTASLASNVVDATRNVSTIGELEIGED